MVWKETCQDDCLGMRGEHFSTQCCCNSALSQEPLKPRTYHCKIRISTHGRFKLLLLQWLYFLLGAPNFWHRQAMLPNYFDIGSGEWTLQRNTYQLCWATKKGKKRPKIATHGWNLASLLLWLYWPVGGHNFLMPHSIWLLVFAMTLLDLYLNILLLD
jgi:hypothetical protein